jgi:nucleoside-diphosphate-sugar epimerase
MDACGARYRQCDVTSFDELKDAMQGMEAVAHLAAVRSPIEGSPSQTIFSVNAVGTFHVYELAERLNIRRVVAASSINALGFNFGLYPFPIRYLPVDEEHPTVTTDPYSFSKHVTEDIADYYWRRSGISGVTIRLPWTYTLGSGDDSYFSADDEHFRRRVEACRKDADDLMALDEEKRRRTIDDLITRFDAYRRQRYESDSEQAWKRLRIMAEGHPLLLFWTDFWAHVDARDSAQAFEKALTRDYEGSHTLFVNDSHNSVGVPSRTLAELFFPEVNDLRGIEGTESLVNIERARELLGYEPEHSLSRLF